MWPTANATGIAPVQIEPNRHGGADVWLRINIEQTTDEEGNPRWEAIETHGVVHPAPTVAEVEEDFDAWWALLEKQNRTDSQRIDELEQRVQEQEDAIVELAELQAEEV